MLIRQVLAPVALMLLVGTAASGQSLGDVARKEAERRKDVKAPGKTFTNDSLRGDTGPTPSSPAPTAAAKPAESPGAASAPQTPGSATAVKPADGTQAPTSAGAKDEGYWKKRLADARGGVDRSKTLAEALQSRVNALTADFSARSDPAQRNQIAADRQRALEELERVRKEIGAGEKAIQDIQEEARKTGVPAGWVR